MATLALPQQRHALLTTDHHHHHHGKQHHEPGTGRCADCLNAGPDGKASPERIRARAYEIYANRLSSGTHGDEVSDWQQAETEVNNHMRTCTRGEEMFRGDPE